MVVVVGRVRMMRMMRLLVLGRVTVMRIVMRIVMRMKRRMKRRK